jgi:hypothetical protein
MDRSQTSIPSTNAVATITLEMFQELTNERCIELFQRQVRGGFAKSFRCKPEKESERIAVARDCVATCASLLKQPIREEGL